MSEVVVEEHNGRWRVRIVSGDHVTTVGEHYAKFRAEEQATRLREERDEPGE